MRLDEFEGDEYARIVVAVRPRGCAPAVQAYTYLWKAHDDADLEGTWSYETDFLPNLESQLREWGEEAR